jgi:4,5-dihydroxyphthalate decarboxylase
MSEKLRLTLATGDYEIVRAIKEGTLQPDGIELTCLTDMDSGTRHDRMVRNREFDICELSGSSTLMAKDLGYDLVAIPVFLHRRFRHGFIFINSTKGIEKPTDLIGRKMGLGTFQSSALLWIRGILEDEFQVPHKKIHWKVQNEEELPFTPPSDLQLERTPKGKKVETMLSDGELDAVIAPNPVAPFVRKDPRVKRLFENYHELEVDYYRRTGIFPIMHMTVIKQQIVDRYPWVPMNLLMAFEKAKQWAYGKMKNPRRVPLAWFQYTQEKQEELMGPDPWAYGLTDANRKVLGTMIRYAHHQGIISQKLSVDELFHESTRGDEWKLPTSRG